MLYCLVFILDALIERFHSIWGSIWRQYRGSEKSWMSSRLITKVQQLRIFILIILIRTPKFVCEIQAKIDNNPSGSIKSIARDMRVPEFITRQVMHVDIWYFSYKMRKEQFLSQAMTDKRKHHTTKFFNKCKHPLQSDMLWFFSDEKNFCQDEIVNSQNNHCLAQFPQDVPIVVKTKHWVNQIYQIFRLY